MPSGSHDAPETENPFLIRFFDPALAEADMRGRTLDDMVHFSDQILEMSHDYIQILFPLPEGSAFNWHSPIIGKEVFEAFRAREDLRTSFQSGFVRMMAFYGFNAAIQDLEHVDLVRSEAHKTRFRCWVVRMDHNHLRITRVIRSLRVLGLEAHAAAFYDAILKVDEDFPKRISPRSMMYWRRAAERPLHLAPDEDDDDSSDGPNFLVAYDMRTTKKETPSTSIQEGATEEDVAKTTETTVQESKQDTQD